MKLHFTQHDSIYYILETIKKIPSYKKNIIVSVDRNHSLFDHSWRWDQLKTIISTNSLDIKFLIYNDKQKEFYISFWFLTIEHKQWFLHVINLIWLWTKWLPLLYLIVLLFASYVWYHLFFSSTNVTISPKNHIDTIVFNSFLCKPEKYACTPSHVPLKLWTVSITLNKTKNVDAILYNSIPSQWFITIYNYLPYELELLNNTRFVAESWEIFFTNKPVKLYASDGIHPTNAEVRVVSQTINETWEFFGTTTNKPKWTKLLAINLPQSVDDGKLYAIVKDGLQWWKLIETNKNLNDELESVKTELQKEVEENVIMHLSKNANNNQTLLYDKRFVEINSLDIQTSISYDGATPFVLATAILWLQYYYIDTSDIWNIIQNSLNVSDSNVYIYDTLDFSKLQFEDFLEIESWLYQTPIRTEVVYYYDFKNDWKKLIEEITTKIQWLSFEQAYSIIMSYDVVLKTTIKNSFWWSNTVSKNTDRILFFLDNN